ncbi:hypothetical protein GCM10022258_34970 [Aquimarina gracilis]
MLFLLTVFTISCSNENFEEVEPDGGNPDTDNPAPDPDPDPDPEDPDNTATTPCDFDLSGVTANQTFVIDCILDLQGETINLPANVTFEFDKGDIINGTLNFSSGGKIDGRLMSSKLELQGDVTLIDPTFRFFPVRWEITEGNVTQPEAFKNHEMLQKVVTLTKEMGASTFTVNKMDAFFDSADIFVPAVFLPSDFHFQMSENTRMRVFPANGNFSTRMFKIRGVENVKLSGGYIIGERDEHGPTPNGSATLVDITTGINIIVENVHMSNSGTTGLSVNSLKFAQDPEYVPSRNILVTGCTFDSNRRNNLSVTDGTEVIIENSKFYRAGIDTDFSVGSSPKAGIDVEPDERQKIDGVIIRNCIEEGGAGASFIASGGNDITFIGNDMQKPMAYNIASNVKIIDNIIREGGIDAGIKSDEGRRRNRGNIISGNTIMNFGVGIKAYNQDIKIFDNKIINCGVGIMMNALKDSEIYNNTITSDIEVSFGINALDYVDNVVVRNNTIDVVGRSVFLDVVNFQPEERDYKFVFRENNFNTGNFGMMRGTIGVDIIDNTFNNGFRIDASENVLFKGNNIINNTPFTVHISNSETSKNITIEDNIIENTDTGGQGNGILGSSPSDVRADSNIVIRNNTFKVKGFNNGININGFNNLTIEGNKGESEDRPFIYYRGDNSVIRNNQTLAGVATNDIEGNNNVVQNN